MLGAGKVLNYEPNDGWFSVDLKSLDNENLIETRTRKMSVVEEVTKEEELEYSVEDFQQGPAGIFPGPRDSLLIRIAEESSKIPGKTLTISPRGFSDMNVGIKNQISSTSTGGDRSGGRNTTDEYVNIEPNFDGMIWNFLICYVLVILDPNTTQISLE